MRRIHLSSLVALLICGVLSPSPSTAANPRTPEWASSTTIYEVNIRQYSESGTFKAVTASLPRLRNLGVGILWLMPVQPISQLKRKGALGSPYSVADYKGINPEFGNPDDFKALVGTAHTLGMKVIMDWVANHSGWDNPWISNKSWYHQDDNGNIIAPNNDWTDVAWLNYENADLRAAMIDAMKYWVTQFDIDGFRADYASGVPIDFWEESTSQLQAIKPLLMLAEEQGTRGMLDKAFQSNYNWTLLGDLNGIAQGRTGVASFVTAYNYRLSKYPRGTFPMNFITNHDENSWNGSEYKRMGANVEAMAALSFIFPGMPLIYSGQEVGNIRELEFFEKDQIPNIEDENTTTTFYKNLINLKKKNVSLWNTAPLKMTDIFQRNLNVLSFARSVGKNRVIYILNTSEKNQKVTLKLDNLAGSYLTFPTNSRATLSKSWTLTLKPWQFEIYSTSGN
ncbi:AmyA Glycosidases [Candidatus Nanopelagicaceae bacterium]